MRKPVQSALTVLLLAAIFGILAWGRRQPEPTYQGKSLTAWLKCLQSDGSSKEANAALLSISTNAFPILLRMLRAHDTPLKLKLVDLAQKLGFIPNPCRTGIGRSRIDKVAR